jgi:hypothetical protein
MALFVSPLPDVIALLIDNKEGVVKTDLEWLDRALIVGEMMRRDHTDSQSL